MDTERILRVIGTVDQNERWVAFISKQPEYSEAAGATGSEFETMLRRYNAKPYAADSIIFNCKEDAIMFRLKYGI